MAIGYQRDSDLRVAQHFIRMKEESQEKRHMAMLLERQEAEPRREMHEAGLRWREENRMAVLRESAQRQRADELAQRLSRLEKQAAQLKQVGG